MCTLRSYIRIFYTFWLHKYVDTSSILFLLIFSLTPSFPMNFISFLSVHPCITYVHYGRSDYCSYNLIFITLEIHLTFYLVKSFLHFPYCIFFLFLSSRHYRQYRRLLPSIRLTLSKLQIAEFVVGFSLCFFIR